MQDKDKNKFPDGARTPIKINLTNCSLTDVLTNSIDYKLSKALIDPSADYPAPETVIGIQAGDRQIPLCTRGGLSLNKGAAKVGKTGLNILFAAAVLNGKLFIPDSLTLLLLCESQGVVIYADCEQGGYYGSITANRIKALAPDCSKLRYYDFRQYSAPERLALITDAIKREPNVALVIIDGLRDILFDFNDPKESAVVITKLMALSVTHNCHISLALHTNKADKNGRGHAGAEATNKSETVFQVDPGKENGTTLISGEYTRGLGFDSFAFTRDEKGVPTIVDPNKITITSMKKINGPAGIELQCHEDFCYKVFGSKSELTPREIIEGIKKVLTDNGLPGGYNSIQNFKRYWIEKGLITTNGEKTNKLKYELLLL